MAHTFDDVSKSSATNYLFFFAQRALAHQDEPPTPPPLNALGLPCEAMCRLWARLYPEQAACQKYLSIYLKSIKATGRMLAAAKEKAATEVLKGTVSLTAEKIQPLADKIKEYILDHQREESSKQREEMQTVQAGIQKVQEEVLAMQQRFDDVHLKLDESTSKLDETIQLIRNLANPWPR
jgi:hypothetical protein